jgi:hypothetical protein
VNAKDLPKPDPEERKSIQARIDLLQKLVADYRTRAYQMVLAHVLLTVGLCKYITGATRGEIRAAAIGLSLVTILLFVWLFILMKQSDKNVGDAKELYKRVGAQVSSDSVTGTAKRGRLWYPVMACPVVVMVAGLTWIAAAWPWGCQHDCRVPRPGCAVAPSPDPPPPSADPTPARTPPQAGEERQTAPSPDSSPPAATNF